MDSKNEKNILLDSLAYSNNIVKTSVSEAYHIN